MKALTCWGACALAYQPRPPRLRTGRSQVLSSCCLLNSSVTEPVGAAMACDDLELNSERYVGLMEKLIGETEFLQDNPPKFVPEENR